MSKRDSLNATLVHRREINPGLFVLRISPDDGVPDFSAGQYIALGIFIEGADGEKNMVKRSYSIASAPSDREVLEFFIVEVGDGALTPRLLSLPVGARVHIGRRAVGTFLLPELSEGAALFFVSTGTGLAPFLSMLKSEGVLESGREISLLHGVRHSRELAYRELLEEFAKQNPQFHYFPTVSREDPSWIGARGYVQHFFTQGTLQPNPKSDHVFLCGNPAMVEELERYFQERGFTLHQRKQSGNLHTEKYW